MGVPVRGESVWDAAVRVRAALHAHTSYDLHAGKPDEGEDPVSFFLEDSHRGFCMHYAAAGTLMLRYLGYESRYAEGYLVTEDAFQKNADGSYTAGVTVNTAHAWTEIYFDGIGWIPFEMTPGYGEAASADEPETEEPDMPASESTEENTEENTAVETETPSETKPQGESLGRSDTGGGSRFSGIRRYIGRDRRRCSKPRGAGCKNAESILVGACCNCRHGSSVLDAVQDTDAPAQAYPVVSFT